MHHEPHRCRGYRWPLAILLLIATQLSATPISVKVKVLQPAPCTINDGNPISVNFDEEGDIVTTRVNGLNYMKKIPYDVQCDKEGPNTLKLQITGVVADLGSNVLMTNKPGLGIALLSNGKPLALNQFIEFTYPNIPPLSAVPIKLQDQALTAGDFSAGAMIEVFYL
ncbi:putative minor fimbrial subunit StfF [Serratia fonticola]|uniref:fimbrial protein n=1 Tax=Serratia fonticola TaxID=47917 RepID=UPI002179AF25|nr:fimbrial protein [Serratia fonticola]CAI1948938.1 putative minor fimbrial subunit StfF [Serratia fonticola]